MNARDLRNFQVIANPGQIEFEVTGERVILCQESGQFFSLSETSSRVWELIQQPRHTSEIQECLVREYDVQPERCHEDLVSLLLEMADAGLIEIQDEQNAKP